MALDTADMAAALERSTYRPGWQFTLTDTPFEGPLLRIVATVTNSYDPATTVDRRLPVEQPPPPIRRAPPCH